MRTRQTFRVTHCAIGGGALFTLRRGGLNGRGVEGSADLHRRRVNPRGQVLSHHRLLDKSEWCTILKFQLGNLYKVFHLLSDLGWVDLVDLGCYTSFAQGRGSAFLQKSHLPKQNR